MVSLLSHREGDIMHRMTRTMVGAVTAVGLLVGGAGAAQAITSNTAFDGIMNRFQQSRYFQDQEKVRAGTPSNIEFDSIGGTYSANVKAENRQSGTQYTERKGLGRHQIYNIENKTPVGQKTRLIVTNNTWTRVTVSIDGWYRTN